MSSFWSSDGSQSPESESEITPIRNPKKTTKQNTSPFVESFEYSNQNRKRKRILLRVQNDSTFTVTSTELKLQLGPTLSPIELENFIRSQFGLPRSGNSPVISIVSDDEFIVPCTWDDLEDSKEYTLKIMSTPALQTSPSIPTPPSSPLNPIVQNGFKRSTPTLPISRKRPKSGDTDSANLFSDSLEGENERSFKRLRLDDDEVKSLSDNSTSHHRKLSETSSSKRPLGYSSSCSQSSSGSSSSDDGTTFMIYLIKSIIVIIL